MGSLICLMLIIFVSSCVTRRHCEPHNKVESQNRLSTKWGLNWESFKSWKDILTFNENFVIATNIRTLLPLFALLNTCNELVEEYLINQTLCHPYKNKNKTEFYRSHHFLWYWYYDAFKKNSCNKFNKSKILRHFIRKNSNYAIQWEQYWKLD